MPVLESSAFQAIIGLGPPGEPIEKARQEVANAVQAANKWLREDLPVPDSIMQRVNKTRAILKHETSKYSLLENLGVTSFSQCLGKKSGSPGYFVWNDMVPALKPNLF